VAGETVITPGSTETPMVCCTELAGPAEMPEELPAAPAGDTEVAPGSTDTPMVCCPEPAGPAEMLEAVTAAAAGGTVVVGAVTGLAVAAQVDDWLSGAADAPSAA
jgi:hypothetical protein